VAYNAGPRSTEYFPLLWKHLDLIEDFISSTLCVQHGILRTGFPSISLAAICLQLPPVDIVITNTAWWGLEKRATPAMDVALWEMEADQPPSWAIVIYPHTSAFQFRDVYVTGYRTKRITPEMHIVSIAYASVIHQWKDVTDLVATEIERH